MRELHTNQHVIVEACISTPQANPSPSISLPKATLIQNFGKPTIETEKQLLLATYAYDSKKELRKTPDVADPISEPTQRVTIRGGFTFHIDPPGCRDVDDSFTFLRYGDVWKVAINIADVASWVPEGSVPDLFARARTTTFYSYDGNAMAPMLSPTISENKASLLVGEMKPTLSLTFIWQPGNPPRDFQFIETFTQTTENFTYEKAAAQVEFFNELRALRELTTYLGGDYNDSHTWVQAMMILYNEHAAHLLHRHGKGILRRHSAPKKERLEMISSLKDPGLLYLAYESAEYCLATDDTNHFGLAKRLYAYASSPLRRYADLVNQRLIKATIHHTIHSVPGPSKELVDSLNRRQKQAKAFTRDMFFSHILAKSSDSVKGKIIERKDGKLHIWVPHWKRIIKTAGAGAEVGELNDVRISWYDNRESARWKDRMVFRIEPASDPA